MSYIRYILIALAAIAMANCLKHLVRSDSWPALFFVLIKDAVVAAFVVYLFRVRRRSDTGRLADFAMWAILMISFVADYAIVVLKA